MMSMTELLAALNAIEGGPRFVAWAWDAPPDADAWGAAAPDGAREDYAGDRVDDQAITGMLHLFVRSGPAGLISEVQDVLDESGMAWHLNAILYDNDARAVHIAWDWETVSGL